MLDKIKKIDSIIWMYSYTLSLMLIYYFLDEKGKELFQKSLSYDTLYTLLWITMICIVLMTQSKSISKLLLKNERIRKWAEKKYAR